MTYRMALKTIRRATRGGDGLEDTFRIICQNRDCHPIRDWAIYDLARAKKLDQNTAVNRYNRHLKRLQEIFRAQPAGYLWRV